MNDETDPTSNRGPWIIGGAIVLAAIVVVAGFVLTRQDPCDAWLADFDRWVNMDSTGIEDDAVVSDQEAAALRELKALAEDRPTGCEAPDGWQSVVNQVETLPDE